ncbi:transketolase [Pilibacter termitis]|uniref:Transketolase n=1 Tax=Pilibacter termitis TaxID=263852 RepID=A0A1T4LZ30_9ENTE|nr:transketolase [Pilibacter termitis]SJZ59906.1 transketolase [Pilibacter termitis]
MSQEDLNAITAIRALSIDMIEKANSGHPGMPLGAAVMGYALFGREMNISPSTPHWFNRDRFVLAAGHGSALLYSMMYLLGYEDVSLEELKQFRQLGSKTPGHPEYTHTVGVDATSGPLGQGIGTACGFALAESYLSAKYNQENFDLVNHYTFALCGDGDLMEGVSGESSSLAGHLGLGKLIVLYDSNDISLDGELSESFSENVRQRYEAYGWQTLLVEDGNDLEAIINAIQMAKDESNKPTLIEVKTTIGFGSPNKAGKSSSHGSPLGEVEAQAAKDFYGWQSAPFEVPEEILAYTREIGVQGDKKAQEWLELYLAYQEQYPQLAEEFLASIEGDIELEGLVLPSFEENGAIATRSASGIVLNALSEQLPDFLGGSADLASSNKTNLTKFERFSAKNRQGKNIWFGVREFGMGTILNGMTLHGGVRVFGSTFFVFSDYVRPAIRMSALMNLPVWYIFTHDSIAVGEDGPTHEPIEHLASLRAMPNVRMYRPADAKEVVAAYKHALLETNKPSIFVLSRQDLPVLPNPQQVIDEGVAKGAYIVSTQKKESDGILIATGSEVALALEVQALLAEKGIYTRVVSMPSSQLFDEQSKEYQEEILPEKQKNRLSIECGTSLGWRKYVGDSGVVISIDEFGASGKAEVLMEHFGFTATSIAEKYLAAFGK